MHTKSPLVVVVHEDRYDTYVDTTSPMTLFRTVWYAQVLKGLGGISDTVKPGCSYYFYLTRKGFKFTAHLELRSQP